MSKANEPAFPCDKQHGPKSEGYPRPFGYGGLTKREYFAAMALQGFIAANPNCDLHQDMHELPKLFAEGAVMMADALITKLETEN